MVSRVVFLIQVAKSHFRDIKVLYGLLDFWPLPEIAGRAIYGNCGVGVGCCTDPISQACPMYVAARACRFHFHVLDLPAVLPELQVLSPTWISHDTGLHVSNGTDCM